MIDCNAEFLFEAGDKLINGLTDLWSQRVSYREASELVSE